MARPMKKPLFTSALVAGVAFLAGVAFAQAPQGAPQPAAGVPAAGVAPAIFEGPTGRVALTRWTLRRDPANRGLALGWPRGGFAGSGVNVPDDVSPAPFSGRGGVANFEGSLAWYRTSFRASSAGVYALAFQSANFQAEVWVDGQRLGSHRGSYLPFEVRARLAAGTHTVVVRVDWRDPAAQSREGFHRTWFNWGGLNGEVDVRAIGESELSSPTVQTTLAAGASAAVQAQVRVSVEVHNNGPARTLKPEGTLERAGQVIPVSFAGLALAHDQTATASTTATVTQPALWSPVSPSLYTLSLQIPGESGYTARVGLRQLSWRSGHIYLNGERLALHGATIQEAEPGQGDALTPAGQNAIIKELQAIGANAARAQHPLDPGMLERLDAAGILVWQGIGPVEGAGNWYSSTPALLGEAEQQARTAALAAELHPSIIAWNLVDEVAGNGRDGAEVAYVRTLARWLHARDPGRMVAVDVWGDHPPQHPGALYSEADAIAETDYTGWYDAPHDSPAGQEAMMRSRLAAMHRAFAGKVLLISEFGAESNALNPSARPGGYGFQSQLLARHIAVYERDPELSGMLIWLLRDYPLTPTFQGGSIHAVLPGVRLIEGLNQKGLFTYNGTPKPAAGVIARLFAALPKG